MVTYHPLLFVGLLFFRVRMHVPISFGRRIVWPAINHWYFQSSNFLYFFVCPILIFSFYFCRCFCASSRCYDFMILSDFYIFFIFFCILNVLLTRLLPFTLLFYFCFLLFHELFFELVTKLVFSKYIIILKFIYFFCSFGGSSRRFLPSKRCDECVHVSLPASSCVCIAVALCTQKS